MLTTQWLPTLQSCRWLASVPQSRPAGYSGSRRPKWRRLARRESSASVPRRMSSPTPAVPLQGSPAEVSGRAPSVSSRLRGGLGGLGKIVAGCAPDVESASHASSVCRWRPWVCVDASRLGLGCAVLGAPQPLWRQQGQAAGILLHPKQLWFFQCCLWCSWEHHTTSSPKQLLEHPGAFSPGVSNARGLSQKFES